MLKKINQVLFSKEKQISLLEQWQSLDQYGLSVKEFCNALIENGDDTGKIIGKDGIDAIGRGAKFTKALEGWMPAQVVASISISENMGDRQQGLEAAINQLNGGQNIIKELAGLLAFPVLLLFVFGFLGLYVSDEILSGIDAVSGIGFDINSFVSSFGIPALLIFILVFVGVGCSLPMWAGGLRQRCNGLPVFSVYKFAVASELLTSLGNLISCGMSLDEALNLIEKEASLFVVWHIKKMREQRRGELNLGKIINTGLIIPFELGALRVLGESADYSVLLLRSGVNHKKYIEAKLKTIRKVTPLVGLLIVIAFFIALVGSAVYQLVSSLNII